MRKILHGWVVRAGNNGFGIIVGEDEKEYPFRLGAWVGYRGEDVKKLGLKCVTPVTFMYDGRKVVSVSRNNRTTDTRRLVLDYSQIWICGGKVVHVDQNAVTSSPS